MTASFLDDRGRNLVSPFITNQLGNSGESVVEVVVNGHRENLLSHLVLIIPDIQTSLFRRANDAIRSDASCNRATGQRAWEDEQERGGRLAGGINVIAIMSAIVSISPVNKPICSILSDIWFFASRFRIFESL